MVGGYLGTIRVKNRNGIFPIFMLSFGIILIIIGIVNLFINYNNINYVNSIALFVIGIFMIWIGYALRKYGQLPIPDLFLGSRYYEKWLEILNIKFINYIIY